MSGITTFDLNEKDVKSLLLALNGDVVKSIQWCSTLTKWLEARDLKLKILALAQLWLQNHSKKTGRHKDGAYEHRRPDEENLQDWVYHQMEYMSGLIWDGSLKEVVVNKYASSRPLLRDEETKELLEFLTLEIRKEYCI